MTRYEEAYALHTLGYSRDQIAAEMDLSIRTVDQYLLRSRVKKGIPSHKRKLSPDDVREIRKAVAAGEVQADLAVKYSVGLQTINKTANRYTYAWVE